MTNLFRGVHESFPENLEERIKSSDRPLRIKLGIDPTGSELHLGHSILLRKLRAFQDAGHTAVLIIGKFTAQIGDPTGKSEVRQQLTRKQVDANAETYLNQVRSFLDFDTPGRLDVRYNSGWFTDLNMYEMVELLAIATVGQMLAKEGFAERYRQGNPIHLHEFIYPLMQGYDSLMVDADIELGGTDQKFNIAIARDIQRHFGQTPQFGLLMPILIGTDGTQKMSKSLDNYIGLAEDALTMYSKLEKIPDTLILQYFELLTDLSLDELPEEPRDRQKLLALEIVTQYHGKETAIAAQKAAGELVRGGSVESDAIPEFSLALIQFPVKAFYLVSAIGLCKSSSDARRQIEGGAVRLDGEKLERDRAFDSPDELHGKVIQFGKSKFIRLAAAMGKAAAEPVTVDWNEGESDSDWSDRVEYGEYDPAIDTVHPR